VDFGKTKLLSPNPEARIRYKRQVKFMAREKLIELKNLRTYFYSDEGTSKAVDGVDFDIYCGEILGVVGESGCGKSVTALSIMRLIPEPPGKIVDGEIFFRSKNLLDYSRREMDDIRGNNISMIFQEPMTSLNPVLTIGDQISEAILFHKDVNKKEAKEQSIYMLKKVGIPMPEQRFREYPHQLSGGMRQRVMIAMALSCDPKLLIADEPTTALDVTIQAQILDLLNSLKNQFDMSIMMITHNLGVVAEVADRVAVMYAGKIVEYTDAKNLFGDPQHPYTWGLMNSLPRMDKEVDRLEMIPGVVPSPLEFPEGCKFNPRCPLADKKCIAEDPDIEEVKAGHKVRCWHYKKLKQLKRKLEDV
jgi:peptide/nickel transport system ATP-binding protein/oligopeptide transport system ATP-binding protein